jgi:predicted O-methyltransferase YrrM
MIGDAPLSISTGIPGWETEAEERALINLAREYVPDQDGVIVELGVEYGRSTAQFAYATKEKLGTKIASVDLYPDDHHIAAQYGGLLSSWQQNLAESGVTSYPAYIIPIRGVSWEIGANWKEPIDLLFIDAGHNYDEVKRDISAWVDHVKAGGLIIFHDYAKDENAHPLHHEVKRAVDEWFDNRTEKLVLIDAPDSLMVFQKYEPAKIDRLSQEPAKKAAPAPKKAAAKSKAKTTRTHKPKSKA